MHAYQIHKLVGWLNLFRSIYLLFYVFSFGQQFYLNISELCGGFVTHVREKKACKMDMNSFLAENEWENREMHTYIVYKKSIF